MDVARRQQLAFTLLEPADAGVALASWAVPVATRVLGDGRVSAAGTSVTMTAERSSAATRDGQQYLLVLPVDPLAAAFHVALPRIANDVGHLQRGPTQALRGASPGVLSASISSGLAVALAGAERGLLTRCPQYLGGHRTARCMPPVAGKQPHCRLVPESTPVGTQCLQQRRTQHHVSVLATLAASDVNHHPLAVDVGHLQVSYLGAASASGVEGHEQDAMKGCLCSIDQTRDFLFAEHLRKVQHLLRIRCLGDAPAPLQDLDVKEAKSGQPLCDRVRSQLPGAEHGCLVLPDVLRTKMIRRTMEVPSEVLDRADISASGGRGVVATLQLL